MKKRRSQIPVVPALVGLGAIAVAAVVLAQPGSRPKAAAGTAHLSSSASPAVVASAATTPGGRKPLSFYTGGVRGDLFTSPDEVAKQKLAAAPPPPPPPPPIPQPVDVLGDFAYKGTVSMGGKSMALIENTKTAEGQYVGVGDFFMGGKVTEVGDRLLSLDLAGKPRIMAKTDDFALVPLTKSAPFLTNQGQNGQAWRPRRTGPLQQYDS